VTGPPLLFGALRAALAFIFGADCFVAAFFAGFLVAALLPLFFAVLRRVAFIPLSMLPSLQTAQI
jgi:hypothetical protein